MRGGGIYIEVNTLKLIECGKIVNIHGVRGYVKVVPWCDSADFLCSLEKLYLQGGASLKIEDAFVHKGNAIIKFAEIKDANDAERLKNTVLYMDKLSVELEENSFFIDDLIGLKVINMTDNTEVGEISEVINSPAQDVYVITRHGKTYMVPAVKEFVKEIDLSKGTVKIMPIKGLLDDED